MGSYLLRRLLLLLPVLLGISLLVFAMLHLIPGDPAQVMLGERATPEAVSALRRELGLDQPLPYQAARYLWKILHLNFGRSIQSNTPVATEIAERFPATVELALAAMILATLGGVFLGIVAAIKRGTLFDFASMSLAILGISTPVFWLGLLLVLLLSSTLGWFPFSGRIPPTLTFPTPTRFYLLDSLLSGEIGNVKEVIWHLFLPALTLSTIPMAIVARMTRSSLLEVLQQDYLRTALAKGISPGMMLLRHALKNALIPVVTVIGLEAGYLLGGAILTETVFAWPGLGRLIVEAIFQRDYPLVQGCILVIATTFVSVNLLVDLSYAWLDPRIRYGK